MRPVTEVGLVGVVLASSLALPARAEVGTTISAAERSPLPVVIAAPQGAMRSTSRSGLLRLLTDVAREHTDLTTTELAGANTCVDDIERQDRFRCLGMLSRATDDLVLIVSIAPKADADRISVVLLDAKRARKIANDGRDQDAGDVETRIRREAIAARVDPATTTDEIDVEKYVRTLFEEALRGALAQAGHWQPYGAIEIRLDTAGFEIEIDGRAVAGVTAAPTTRITEVRAGRRTVALRRDGYEPVRETVEVTAGQAVHWAPQPRERATDHGGLNSAVLWSSIAVATGGAVLAGVGVAASSPSLECFEPPCELGAAPKAIRSDRYSSAGSGGFSYLSLSVGLLATGATTLLLHLLWEEDTRVPWLEVVVGVGVGLAGFGTAYAIGQGASNSNDDVLPVRP